MNLNIIVSGLIQYHGQSKKTWTLTESLKIYLCSTRFRVFEMILVLLEFSCSKYFKAEMLERIEVLENNLFKPISIQKPKFASKAPPSICIKITFFNLL